MKPSKLELLVSTPNISQKKEPALLIGGVVTGVSGLIVLVLNTFFPNLVTEEVKVAIFGIAAIFVPIIMSWLIRRKVWSPASVEEAVEEAVKTQPTLIGKPSKLSKDFFKENNS